MTSSSTYLMLASHAPLRRPPLVTLVARTAAASITRGARASVTLFVNPAACRPGVRRRGWAQICRDSSLQGPPGGDSPAQEQEDVKKSETVSEAAARIAGGSGGSFSDWTTSVLIFGIWAGLMYYVFLLAPNQTPYQDTYLLQKLLNLKGDDGFRMNDVLVSLWYIMGLWPLVYSMLLLPTGRWRAACHFIKKKKQRAGKNRPKYSKPHTPHQQGANPKQKTRKN